MSVSDDDVAQAILVRFSADSMLPGLIPGGLTRGREIAAVTAQKTYGNLEVGEGDPWPGSYSTGGFYIDSRAVTLSVRGLEADVRAAMSQLQIAYAMDPAGGNLLTIPNATHLVTWPVGRAHLEQDPATKNSEDIWLGTLKYRVMSVRAWPN